MNEGSGVQPFAAAPSHFAMPATLIAANCGDNRIRLRAVLTRDRDQNFFSTELIDEPYFHWHSGGPQD